MIVAFVLLHTCCPAASKQVDLWERVLRLHEEGHVAFIINGQSGCKMHARRDGSAYCTCLTAHASAYCTLPLFCMRWLLQVVLLNQPS